MNDYYFYFNNVLNCTNKLVIIKAIDEEKAKQILINTYFKGFNDLTYDELIYTLEQREYYITFIENIITIEDKECLD